MTTSSSTPSPVARARGPAGALVLLDETPGMPLVSVIVAARIGSASDPAGKEGLAYLGAQLARHGAGSRDRAALEDTLDGLGASMHVDVDAESTRFVGQVLLRNLDAYLDLIADIVLCPRMEPAELERTRAEVLANMEEARNDDRTLCARFFDRRLYGQHPYAHAADGYAHSLPRIELDELVAQHQRAFVGPSLIFAAAGGLSIDDFRARIEARFAAVPDRAPPPAPVLPPVPRHPGGRIQLVDKPDRSQTQIMFGHPTVPAGHPDRPALLLALATFGGRGMNATLMDEIRTKRGLAYGAYMSYASHRGPGALRGWVYTARKSTVTTLKLALGLYRKFRDEGVSPERLRFFQGFLVGTHAADMDDPAHRLDARVNAEIDGLPPDEIDSWPSRLQALTHAEVSAAIERHVEPDALTITLVGTAPALLPLLARGKLDRGAIDVVPWDRD